VNTTELAALLTGRGLTVATAESCTGGLVAAELTSVPGSSVFMRGGVVAYANELKTGLLTVDAELIVRHGAVSAEVALAMAKGVRDLCRADIGVSVTGVAGPEGSETKPPGLIYLCASRGDAAAQIKLEGDFGRAENRRRAVVAAIELIGRVA
jgi:nicotinamide-nucleotide amidase